MTNNVYTVEAYDNEGTLAFNRAYLTKRIAERKFGLLAASAACVSLFRNFEKVREVVQGVESDLMEAA